MSICFFVFSLQRLKQCLYIYLGSGTMRLGHDLAVGRKERWCWQLMCMAFIVTVLDFLLLRSGDVEMNPGPSELIH